MERLKQFLRDESGTATVEYTVLTAVTIGMAVASTSIIKEGAASASDDLGNELSDGKSGYEIEVQTVYDAEFMEAARYAMGGFSLEEMRTITAFMDDMLLLATTEEADLAVSELQMLSDFDIAVDMTWLDMGLPRPTDATWTAEDLMNLPGDLEPLAYTQ